MIKCSKDDCMTFFNVEPSVKTICIHCASMVAVDPNYSEKLMAVNAAIKIIKGEMPIGMQGCFNLCDVRDLAAGCIAAADKGRQGECYILANEEVTLKELCNLLDHEKHFVMRPHGLKRKVKFDYSKLVVIIFIFCNNKIII